MVEYFGKLAVYVDGAPQSGAEIKPMWEKIIKNFLPKADQPQAEKLKIKNSLVLGIGGGDVIKSISKRFPQSLITAVELDPVMREIACKYFGLNKITALKIIIDDAISYISKRKTGEKFDLIVVDLFIGKLNPKDSRTFSFIQKLKMKLEKGGIILFNSHDKPDEPDEFESFYRYCQKIFTNSEIIFSYRFNRVILMR